MSADLPYRVVSKPEGQPRRVHGSFASFERAIRVADEARRCLPKRTVMIIHRPSPLYMDATVYMFDGTHWRQPSESLEAAATA